MNTIARCLLATLPCAALAASEATDDVTIDHWGNALMVTAPDNHQDPMVARKLQAEVTLNLVDASIEDVANSLRLGSGANIVIDPSLREANPTITMKVVNMSAENALHWVCELGHCTWQATDGVLYLSTHPVEGAKKTVLYDISDLIAPVRDFPGPELAFNESGKGSGALLKPVEPEGDKGTSLEDFEDFLRKSLNAQSQR